MGELTWIDNFLVIGAMISGIIGIYILGKLQERKGEK